jgi:hypothetical protein
MCVLLLIAPHWFLPFLQNDHPQGVWDYDLGFMRAATFFKFIAALSAIRAATQDRLLTPRAVMMISGVWLSIAVVLEAWVKQGFLFRDPQTRLVVSSGIVLLIPLTRLFATPVVVERVRHQ